MLPGIKNGIKLLLIALLGMTLASSCSVMNNARLAKLEARMASSDSSLAALSSLVQTRIGGLESELLGANLKLTSIEEKFNINSDEVYLRVTVSVLNIRTTPALLNNNVIARAQEGAYLRRIAFADQEKQWYKIEFMIDNIPYIGYVANNPDYLKEEYYDPQTFSHVYNRKLIHYHWETEAAMEMKRNRIEILGVFVQTDDHSQRDRYLGHLAKELREHNIYIKPLSSFAMNDIVRQCAANKVQGIMAIAIEPTADATPYMDVNLFSQNSVILYSGMMPLQAREFPRSLGKR